MFLMPDLTLLHAPSIYDFRKKSILYGPISDVIPSSRIFEMYPVGFSSILEHLEKNGFKVRIINLALRMLKSKKFNVEAFIGKLKTKVFGIDLHWLLHAHGSLEVAKICKKYHPDIPVAFGGFSSTYFAKELIKYPEVDFVLMGDSTEEPMLKLMSAIIKKKSFEEIPNLAWKDKAQKVRFNPISHVPEDINGYSNNYQRIFKSALKFLDITGFIPIHDWWRSPTIAVMTSRGCTQNCIICGGSRHAMKKYCGRDKTAFRGPYLIVEDIRKIVELTDAPIFIVGDLRQAGEDYADIVLRGLKKIKLENQVVLELFEYASRDYFKKVADCIENFNFEISPESHDERIRKINGKFYTNRQMEENIEFALSAGCSRFDVFFMIGLSGQSEQSVMETVDYCRYLLGKFQDKRVIPFISPLAPFLDPGSIAYETPGNFGYKIFYRTLEEHRIALLLPSWKHTLNYETNWMSRAEIVNATYEAALRLNKIKLDSGLTEEKVFKCIERNIKSAIEIDRLVEKGIEQKELKSKIDILAGQSILCDKGHLKWPIGKKRFKFLNIIKSLLSG